MQSVLPVENNRILKIKKSKLTFGVLNSPSLIPSTNIDNKHTSEPQITHKSQQNNHLQFRTVNYKNYDSERKSQNHKRKQNQKPLSLYLDGANPLLSKHPHQKHQQTTKVQKIFNLKKHLHGISFIQNIKSEECQRFLGSKKSLKTIILKQIQLKNRRKISQIQKQKIKTPEFSDIQQLFTLKKIQKPNNDSYRKEKLKAFNQQFSFRNNSFTIEKQEDMKSSQKLSAFSQRKAIPNKNRIIIKNPQNSSKVFLPILDKKSSRPLVALNSEQSKKIQSESFVVFNHSLRKVISGKCYKKNAEIASLTKIMTFYTILHICKIYEINYAQQIVQIIEKAEQMSGTSADIFSGQKYTLQQLFYAMMLPSGNDAAVAIACQGGRILKEKSCKQINLEQKNIKCFIKYMNILGKNIGMSESSFSNPHGLSDPNNVSNPYELSLLISECLKFDEFLKVVGCKSYNCWIDGISQRREVIWQNTHKLLRRQGFIGGKTGVTVTAGPCLATIYKSSFGQIFITVVLRAPKLSRRFKQTRWILGLSLKQYNKKYDNEVKSIMKSNKQLDSDNSEDEQKFDFSKNDSAQLRKRNKILCYEL